MTHPDPTTDPTTDDALVERVLAREIVQRGVLRRPGDTVRLRPDQVARLEPGGYFEAPAPARRNKS